MQISRLRCVGGQKWPDAVSPPDCGECNRVRAQCFPTWARCGQV